MRRTRQYLLWSTVLLVLLLIWVNAYAQTPSTEWVNFYSQNSKLDGDPLPVGSTVQAFDPSGVLCGQFEVHTPGEFGLLPCYRDDPTTPEDEGAQPGDVITFYINGAKASASHEPIWTKHGDVFEIDLTSTSTATKKFRLPACFRINFEVSGDTTREGTYEVRELGGRLLYIWHAHEGWQDSGWVYGIDISFENVYIEVFYVSEDDSSIKLMNFNPASGTPYGWLSRGKCHALEVGWPDDTVTPTPTPDAYDGYNDAFDLEELDLQRFIWPEVQPTPSSTPANTLRG